MAHVRKMRHWKQRWQKDAKFVWSRPTTYGCHPYKPGDDLPEELMKQPTKLRRFWESRRIELKDFEAPNVATGQTEDEQSKEPEGEVGVTVTKLKGPWYLVDTGLDKIKVKGKKARDQLLEELRLETEEGESEPAADADAEKSEEDEDFLK